MLASSDAVYIALTLPLAVQPLNLVSVHTSSAASAFFSTLIGSLVSYCDLGEKVSFSRYPPPPFNINTVKREQQSDDIDEEWLPNLKDLISSNYSVLIDLTGKLDSEIRRHLPKM